MRRYCLLALLILSSLWLGAAAPAWAEAGSYSFSVAPVLPATEIKRRWQGVLDQLSQSSGLKLHFQFHENGRQFQRALQKGQLDFVVLGPMQLWQVRDHYRPLVRDDKPMIGLVVVRHDSAIRTLGDLQGKRLAIPDPADLAAGVYLRHQLKRLGIKPRFEGISTHGNGFRAVFIGTQDAAAGDNVNYALQEAELQQKLRIIYQTPPLPSVAIASRRDLPPEHAQALSRALLQLNDSKLIRELPLQRLVEADLDRDYGILAPLLGQEAAGHAP